MRSCPRASLCNLAEACSSRANEEASSIHYHHQNISVPFMSFNSAESEGRSNRRRTLSADRQEEDAERDAMEVEDDTDAEAADGTLDIAGVRISASSYNDVRKVTDAMCALATHSPTAFFCLVRKIYDGASQSDVARQDGVSRQAVNKRLLAELGIAQKRATRNARRETELVDAVERMEEAEDRLKRRDDEFASLSVCEFLAFKMLTSGKMKEADVAGVLGVSERTVFGMRQRLLSRHGISTGRKGGTRNADSEKFGGAVSP